VPKLPCACVGSKDLSKTRRRVELANIKNMSN